MGKREEGGRREGEQEGGGREEGGRREGEQEGNVTWCEP